MIHSELERGRGESVAFKLSLKWVKADIVSTIKLFETLK